jgi:hypothetical protein
VGAAAARFDKWLQETTGGYVTLERFTMVAGGIPIVGNIMALLDAVMDLVSVVQKYVKKQAVGFLDWVSLGINLIGVIPLPPTMAAARMTLRPTLHLVKQQMARGVKNLSETIVTVLVSHLNDKLAGDIENFVDGAMSKLSGLLEDCAKKSDEVADALIDVLNRCLGNKPMFDVPKAVAAEAKLHDSKTQSTWDRMLSAASNIQRRAANYAVSAVASRLPDAAKVTVLGVIGGLTNLKATFRTMLVQLADEKAEQSIKWLLRKLMDAVARRKKQRTVMVSSGKGAQALKEEPGHGLAAIGTQAPAKGDGSTCKLCPAPSKTKRSISFATAAHHLAPHVPQPPDGVRPRRPRRALADPVHDPCGRAGQGPQA